MTTAIRYVVYRNHLDPELSDAEVRGYVARLTALIERAYPGAEVDVEVESNVSGVGAGLQGEPEGVDPDHLQQLADLAWNEGVGECSVTGCARPIYANGLCEAHDRRRRRGSSSTAPVRERGTEPLRALSLRVPESVHAALGAEPGAEARRVLERWAKRRRGR